MTPEQFEAILESNSRAIASNSDTIAALKRETQAQITEIRLETQRQINSMYRLTAELVRERSTSIEILHDDRIQNAENMATIAVFFGEQKDLLTDIAKVLKKQSN